MSWAVRMTKRNTDGLARRRWRRSAAVRLAGWLPLRPRTWRLRWLALTYTFQLVSLPSGSFLRLSMRGEPPFCKYLFLGRSEAMSGQGGHGSRHR